MGTCERYLYFGTLRFASHTFARDDTASLRFGITRTDTDLHGLERIDWLSIIDDWLFLIWIAFRCFYGGASPTLRAFFRSGWHGRCGVRWRPDFTKTFVGLLRVPVVLSLIDLVPSGYNFCGFGPCLCGSGRACFCIEYCNGNRWSNFCQILYPQ